MDYEERIKAFMVVVGIDGIDEHIDVGNYNKYIIMNSLHNYIYF